MKPVFQRTTVPGKGDCLAACLASIMELPIEEVPNFRLAGEAEDAWRALQDWLGERGMMAVRVRGAPEWIYPMPECWCILCGKSGNGTGRAHAVVGKWRGSETVAVHDPNPQGGMLEGSVDWVIFLGVLNPENGVVLNSTMYDEVKILTPGLVVAEVTDSATFAGFHGVFSIDTEAFA